jgi:hypothetical protein
MVHITTPYACAFEIAADSSKQRQEVAHGGAAMVMNRQRSEMAFIYGVG